MTDSTSGDATVAALRSEIEQTRSELGETVEALAAKADVKARARDKVDEARARAATAAAQARDETREKARHLADVGSELVRELRTEPAVPARRAAYRMRSSVRNRPRQWAAVGAALLAFAALAVRGRRTRTAERVTPRSMRDDWRRQWKDNR